MPGNEHIICGTEHVDEARVWSSGERQRKLADGEAPPRRQVAGRGCAVQLRGAANNALDEPAREHELDGWLPQMERESLEGVTVAHLYALLDVAAKVATERDCAQCAVSPEDDPDSLKSNSCQTDSHCFVSDNHRWYKSY